MMVWKMSLNFPDEGLTPVALAVTSFWLNVVIPVFDPVFSVSIVMVLMVMKKVLESEKKDEADLVAVLSVEAIEVVIAVEAELKASFALVRAVICF